MINRTESIYIVRLGETALKGQNKPYFERMILQRVRKVLSDLAGVCVERTDGLIFVRTPLEVSRDRVLARLARVFGIDSVSPALEVSLAGLTGEEAMEEIGEAAALYMNELLREKPFQTFKVEGRRSDKLFPVESPQIGKRVGASILRACRGLRVDVHHPDCCLYVQVRRGFCYLYEKKIEGFGGLPLGTNGRGTVLLSGGIDSPVAAFLMAHRGMYLDAVHFHSYPYTSERAFEKVKELAGILASYCGRIRLYSVNLLPIQEQIVQNCPEEETTILVRRFMMRIAEMLARQEENAMLITGESLGQVASQTAEALVVTDSVVRMPVMRPLIGLDKTTIMEIAKKIGTYEKSIEPYEDCCTVFLPKHPVTKPKLAEIEKSESRLPALELAEQAAASAELTIVREP